MTFSPGTRLGPFEVTSLLGVGGMGEVYRARDTKLERDVAIKVLPEAFAADTDRLTRFKREARVLASLEHPNIGTIHDLQEVQGTSFIVMQLVEGETLADRLSRGALTIDEALPIFAQIAEALEAAHEKGIIHRDLKPANVRVTEEGTVKVIDFGVAKYFKAQQQSRKDETAMTLEGVIVGTVTYMSPEQARGKPVDKRTDIWAFGCCLYESLAGKAPFEGDTVSDTLSAILEHDPDWEALPDSTPANIRVLLRRCLEKDPNRRLHDIADARIEIGETLTRASMAAPITSLESTGPERAVRKAALTGLVGLVVGVTAILVVLRGVIRSSPAPEPRRVRRYSVNLPSAAPLSHLLREGEMPMALSPDGTVLVYVSIIDGRNQLMMRRLDELEAQPIPGTEGAEELFFSPDGTWIAFITKPEGKLKKVRVDGGLPVTLCDASPLGVGASWGDDGYIVFSCTIPLGLARVSDAGGTPETLTTLDLEAGEIAHVVPNMLPGSKAVLFTVATSVDLNDMRIEVLLLDTLERQVLVKAAAGWYVPTGHLICVRQGAILAAPFDVERLKVTGPVVPVTESRMPDIDAGNLRFAFSAGGTLVYVPASYWRNRSLVWVDRQGEEEPLAAPLHPYVRPRLSPDGRRVALHLEDLQDVWTYDLPDGPLSQLTFDPAIDYFPVWTPDGQRVVFASTREGGAINLFWKPADGSGSAERLTTGQNMQIPYSWSPDGRTLAFVEFNPGTQRDVMLLSVDGEGEPTTQPLLQTPFNEYNPELSPDGRWIAYICNESGQYEVYVRPFPNVDGGKWRISSGGGGEPVWATDGGELFYRNGDAMMAVTIETDPSFSHRNPEVLFEGPYYTHPDPGCRSYDISHKGRFLMIKESEETGPVTELIVVENWSEELKRIAPVGKD
jgi:serine/threonine protein kinase/Tol biopolymer transport system component